MWYRPGLPEGPDRLPEGGQPEGKLDRPVRGEDAHGQEVVVGNRPSEMRKKSFSVGSPLTGKQVGCLPPTSGSHPAALGARAGTHNWSGVAFQSPAITQGTSPRPATYVAEHFLSEGILVLPEVRGAKGPAIDINDVHLGAAGAYDGVGPAPSIPIGPWAFRGDGPEGSAFAD